MSTREYTPNSHKYKEEQKNAPKGEKRVEKVVTGKVKAKNNEVRKLADIFISEDIKNVKQYALMDVLVPTIKKAIVDIVTDGISMIFFGGPATRRSNSSTGASYVSYSRASDRRTDSRDSNNVRRSGYSYKDVILEDRAEAEEVLTRMDELLETYGFVSVADMYDLVGITCEYTDNKYGWTSLNTAKTVRARDGGYMLSLPRAYPID